MEILALLGVSSILELITYLTIIICGVIFVVNRSTTLLKDKYGIVLVIAKVAVGAAEKLAQKNGWGGPEKYKYAYDLILKHAKNIPESEIQAIIEDAVLHVNDIPEPIKILIESIITNGGLEELLKKFANGNSEVLLEKDIK